MTKENFITKWAFKYNVNYTTNPYFIYDLEALIAHEIAMAKEVKPEELKGNCTTFDMSRLVDQEQPALNPIAEAYERGEKIRMKEWPSNLWIMKHTKTEAIDELKNTYDVTNWAMKPHPEKWEIYKPTEQPAKPFDRDRFERMFRAVVASGRTESYEQDFLATNICLEKLDAYYATNKGGNEK